MRKVLNRRSSIRMPQHALGSKDDQRLAPLPQRLPPQQMKILRRIRRLANLKIVSCRELQKTFDASTGMLRSLSFVSMWEQQNYT
jgi:hypothetical protein